MLMDGRRCCSWRRAHELLDGFAHGLVLVNPSENTVGHLALGGRYSGAGLSGPRSVTLGPAAGAVRVRAGG
jgi:hypothetical protein